MTPTTSSAATSTGPTAATTPDATGPTPIVREGQRLLAAGRPRWLDATPASSSWIPGDPDDERERLEELGAMRMGWMVMEHGGED